MVRAPLLLLSALAIGCRQVPAAPEELDELCGYLYAHFDDEHPEAVVQGLLNLDSWLLANLEETLEGYSVTSLSEETINALDDRARNPADMIGAAVGTESIYTPYALGVTQLVEDQEALFPDSHDHYERTFLTDPDCFVEEKCEDAEVRNYIEDTYPIIDSVISHNHGQYRWVETDKGLAWLQRTWFEQPAEVEVDWIHIQDQYYLNILLPQEGVTLTLQSMWIEAYWDGLPVSENMAKNLLISQMQNIYTQLDAFIADHGARVEPRGCATGNRRGTWGLLALLGLGLIHHRRG